MSPDKKGHRAAALIESGLRNLQEGRAAQAQEFCRQALALAPRHPEALYLMGVIALQNGDPAAATAPLEQAAALHPERPEFHGNLGYAYIGLKRVPEALSAFQRAARLAPGHPELELAIGNCLGLLKRPAEAEPVFRRVVERQPQNHLAWFNLANAVKDQERYAEACDLYRRVTQIAPRFAEGHCNLGVALHKLGRYEEAEQAYRIAQQAGFVPAFVAGAITLNNLRRNAEAEALCREALARNPAQTNAWPILGRALSSQGRWAEAVHCYERAVSEFPESAEAHGDLGDTLARTGRPEAAFAAFDRAYALGHVPGYVRFLKAVALYSAGRMSEAAAEYEGRSDRAGFVERYPERVLAHELPRDLDGREVCLIGEQGIGDELFFLRYAPALKARGCRVVYHAHPKLTGLLARSAAFDRVVTHTGDYAAADHTLLVGDLPQLLGALAASPHPRAAGAAAPTVPKPAFRQRVRVYWPELPAPFTLRPLPERSAPLAERLRRLGPPPYIGVTWRAGTAPQEQRGWVQVLYKEFSLEHLAAALRGVAGTLVSLQRTPGAGETERLAALAGRPVHDLSEANADLEDMLVLLAALDEYVGVSNTNMHLLAGIGRTARVLVPWPAEWRWMNAGRQSPWFPGFRIYRQRPDGDWGPAVSQLRTDLGEAASAAAAAGGSSA